MNYIMFSLLIANFSINRIKKGYPFEVELLCGVLPDLLTDFFPPSEIMTKVIGEFLSTQQPHPRLLAAVVFQVIWLAVFIAIGHIHYSPQPEICKYFMCESV